jgi:hypothetical protein
LNKRNKTSDNYSGRKSAALSRNKNTAADPSHSQNPDCHGIPVFESLTDRFRPAQMRSGRYPQQGDRQAGAR